ncbi:hypothetical protein WIS52_06215 [Pseudonocardia nematodicida]|uniref:Uncharacterized protein n=1 Tax=Pseudonocardia nematodicida TaxID=1206997 RepID=A0ABV1K6F5_9PSEU
MTDPFAEVAALADAVLFEGYLLYPYRASAQKNRLRWQWGVLPPGGEDPQRVEFLAEPRVAAATGPGGTEPYGLATLRVRVRFLRLERRTVLTADGLPVSELDVDGVRYLPFDEGVPDSEETVLDLRTGGTVPIERDAVETVEELVRADGTRAGRIVRTREPICGSATITATEVPGPYDLVRLRLEVRNDTPAASRGGATAVVGEVAPPCTSDDAGRDEMLRTALIGTHTLLAISPGAFLSPVDPPEWASALTRDCVSDRCWAALAGPPERSDLLLCSPIIVGDYAAIAPESGVDLFDGTENDEILTLRTMVLTDAEKAEARATDPRAAAILDAVDGLPPEMLERLHGAVRSLDEVPTISTPPPFEGPVDAPWWDPGADAAVAPETDAADVGGIPVSRGSTVHLRPGRGTDAQDAFLEGMRATVQAVVHDVDGGVHVAVSLDDDPAAELQLAHGRFRYFRPDELEVAP